jgi:hypothetical protein
MRIKKSKQSSRSRLSYPKGFLVGAVCLLLWRAFFADHETYVLEYYHFHPPDATGKGTTRDSPNFKPIHKPWPETLYDHTLGPAVARAKYFGFANRQSNDGHNRSDWEALTTDKCEEQGAAEFLPIQEIQDRKLPTAILIGVQKGGTTALYRYLTRHPDIDPSHKELYFLDEVLDYYLLNATHPSIPRNRGRELYSQTTLGIYQRWKLKLKQAKQNNATGKGNTGKRSYAIVNTTEGGGYDFYVHTERRKEDEQEIENTTQDQRYAYMVQPNARRPRILPFPTPDESMQQMFKIRGKKLKKGSYIAVDMTPNYMMHSDRVPARIQCLVPWVKLVVILRHPIDRARSQYDMKLRAAKGNPANQINNGVLVNKWGNPIRSFDQFVRNDLDALYELGVLQDWTKVKFEEFWKSEQCWKAWQTYIHSGLNAPVGAGLYALQLKPFLDVLRSMHGVNAKDYFYAIDNQELRTRPDETFQGLLKFLQLEPFSLAKYKMSINQAGGKKRIEKPTHELSPETSRLVRVAIEPYDQKLADLLGAEWRDKWSL